MFGLAIFDYIKMGAAATVGALVAGSVAYTWGHVKGDSAGYARFAAEQTVADLAAAKARSKNDVRIQNLSNYNFCVDALKRRGLPVDSCDELRGLPVKQPVAGRPSGPN